jgi:hypothetical protein
MTFTPRLRLLLLAGLIAAIPACAYLRTHEHAAVENPTLTELSGLAASPSGGDWYWGHNDSGNPPQLFRLSTTGQDLGVVMVEGVENRDWEDITDFLWQGQPALLIGDIGDNWATHDSVRLIAVPEPKPGQTRVKPFWTLEVFYPGGPRDAEGLGVDRQTGEILILSKRERPPAIFRVAMPSTVPTSPVVAERLGPVLHIPSPTVLDLIDDPYFGFLRNWPTALSIAPSGHFAVVTTYKNAYRYEHVEGEPWQASFARKPVTIKLPQFPQTEAGGISNDEHWLLVGSEQRGGLVKVRIPDPVSAPASAPATPP